MSPTSFPLHRQTPTGTPLSAAIPMNGGLMAVGESGVQLLASLQ